MDDKMDDAFTQAYNAAYCFRKNWRAWNKAFEASLKSSGYRIVPEKATDAMINTAHREIRILCEPDEASAYVVNFSHVWRAMIAASEEVK